MRDDAAVLLLPPPSRWTYAAMLAIFIPGLVVIVTTSALLLNDYRERPWAWDEAETRFGFGLLVCAIAYFVLQIVWAANALRKWRQLGNRVEATAGRLVYVNCGVWRDFRRTFTVEQIPNLRVESISVNIRRGKYHFRLQAGRFVRRIRSSRPEFGREATAALRAAVGLPTLAPQMTNGTTREPTRDA